MSSIRDLFVPASFEKDEIIKREYRTFQSLATCSFTEYSNITIPISGSDLLVNLHESYIVLKGEFIADKKGKLIDRNAYLGLFQEIRLTINARVVDTLRHANVASTMMGLALNDANDYSLYAAGWDDANLKDNKFQVYIPLKSVLGIANTYTGYLLASDIQLELIRSGNFLNCIVADEIGKNKLTLTSVTWRVPTVILEDRVKLSVLKKVSADEPIHVSYRSWDVHTMALPTDTKNIRWVIRSAPYEERPRYILFAFQTGRENNIIQDASLFDHANIRNFCVLLDNVRYPDECMNVNFTKREIHPVFLSYVNFKSAYLEGASNRPYLNLSQFSKSPLFCVDLRFSQEEIQRAAVNISLDLESSQNFDPDTIIYAILVFDRSIAYYPLTKRVAIS